VKYWIYMLVLIMLLHSRTSFCLYVLAYVTEGLLLSVRY
jgi:hypothetical protein